MRLNERLTLSWKQPLFLREDDEDEKESKKKAEQGLTLTQLNEAISGQNKKLVGHVESLIKDATKGFVKKDELDGLLKARGEERGDDDNTPDPEPKPDNEENSDMPRGVAARLEQMANRIDTLDNENKSLRQDLQKKDDDAKMSNMRSTALEAIRGKGVTNPEHVFRILRPDMTEVETKSGNTEFQMPIETEFGHDTQPLGDYLDGFLEENPGFLKSSKSGSGGGGDEGSKGVTSSGKIQESDLDPETYFKDPKARERVHAAHDAASKARGSRT